MELIEKQKRSGRFVRSKGVYLLLPVAVVPACDDIGTADLSIEVGRLVEDVSGIPAGLLSLGNSYEEYLIAELACEHISGGVACAGEPFAFAAVVPSPSVPILVAGYESTVVEGYGIARYGS